MKERNTEDRSIRTSIYTCNVNGLYCVCGCIRERRDENLYETRLLAVLCHAMGFLPHFNLAFSSIRFLFRSSLSSIQRNRLVSFLALHFFSLFLLLFRFCLLAHTYMCSSIKQWYTYRYRQLTHSASVYWFRFCLRCVVQCSSYVEQSEWYRCYIRVWTKSYVMLLVWMSECVCIKCLDWCIVCACECASVFVYSSRMLVGVWVSVCVCFLCFVVTHFFDNAHFALKHVLVDFLLSKIISFGSVAFVSILRSCVLALTSFGKCWPLNLRLVLFCDCVPLSPIVLSQKFYYCHQFEYKTGTFCYIWVEIFWHDRRLNRTTNEPSVYCDLIVMIHRDGPNCN